jgi:serine/threonine protein kinase/Tol biopolymer transport system component
MSLAPGVRLGPYTILAALGAGGMGEVYRAHDSRLGRDVAIKVLPAAFSEDPDRLRRFEQEARATAALNHPNILAVHDIGIEGNAPFIVSELLEGQTLREQLRGATPIPVRTAVGYAIAIARGLAAAHEKGVVHRDLKPDNLFITADGRVKILDFGLAKLLEDGAVVGDASALPTESPHTAIGLVLGTVGYMSPEQVRGLAVDHRTDVFAFGAIVYEVLSGSRAFDRQTAPETLTAILNDHPHDLGSNHRAIPPALVHIVERCLEKKPSARFQTASDLAFALETLSDTTRSPTPPHAPGTASPSRRGGWIGWAVAGVLLATLAPLSYQHVVEQPVAVEPIRFRIPPAVELAGPGNFSISPDGRHLAFFGLGSDGTARLWVRDMQSLDVRSVAGSDVFGPAPPPFWSPDSRFIAFDAGGKLKKVEVSGGPAQTLCDLPGVGVGGTWNSNGEILVGNTEGGVLRVRETGGTVVPVTTLDADRKEEFHLLPTFLPDGRHFVYLRSSPSAPDLGGTYIGSIDAKPEEQSTERLMPYAVGVTYAVSKASGVGLLLYVREGTLVGQPFDPDRLALVGGATPITERVGTFRDGAFFATSANDVLVYRTADTDTQVSRFDRQGLAAGPVSDPGGFRGVTLSPDGTRAVASRTNPQDPSRADLWLLDLARGGALRFTSGSGLAESPVWSPDGTRVVFTVDKNSIHEKLTSGEGDERELLRSTSAGLATPTGWSPDGRFLMYFVADVNSRFDLWVSASDGRKPVPFARSEFVEDQGVFSPDGRWVAYISNQSGAYEVYVRGFTSDFSSGSASVGGSTPISRRGGTSPRWRRDGRELFYLAADGKMMAVDVRPGPEFQAGIPAPLFQTAPGTVVGDVSADGRRFLLVTPVGPSASAPFTVVLNWTTGLKH